MPHRLARAEAADRHAVLDDVRDDVDLRVAFDEPPAVLLHGRLVEIAEAAAECDQIVVAQLLIANEQHLMVEPRAMDRREAAVVERAQVDAGDFGAERGACWETVESMAHLGWRTHQV